MSQHSVFFFNPGEIDIRAVVIMGVNVKEGPSIGQFGTGVKYAIAGILRLGGSLTIHSGGNKFNFRTAPMTIRGKEFQSIEMIGLVDSQVLGFTTDLGRHWAPWMLFRELLSNALDEGGWVSAEAQDPRSGATVVEVDCPAIWQEFQNREAICIRYNGAAPCWTSEALELYPSESPAIYYRGIRATRDVVEGDAAWPYTINILSQSELSEDRFFADINQVKQLIAQQLLICASSGIVDDFFTSSLGAKLDYDWPGHEVGSSFIEAVVERAKARKAIPSSARAAVKRRAGDALASAETIPVPTTWAEMLAQAPEVREVRHHSYEAYVAIDELEKRATSAEARARYWQRCARSALGVAAEASDAELQDE